MRKWSCQSRQTTCCTSHGGNYSFPPYLTPTLSLTKSGESDSPDQVLKSIHAKSPWRIDGGVWGWWRAKHKGPLGPTLHCVNMTLLNCVQSTSFHSIVAALQLPHPFSIGDAQTVLPIQTNYLLYKPWRKLLFSPISHTNPFTYHVQVWRE